MIQLRLKMGPCLFSYLFLLSFANISLSPNRIILYSGKSLVPRETERKCK